MDSKSITLLNFMEVPCVGNEDNMFHLTFFPNFYLFFSNEKGYVRKEKNMYVNVSLENTKQN